jgi:hypothetical protein
LCEACLPVRQGSTYIFLTFWVLLACPDSIVGGQAKSTINKAIKSRSVSGINRFLIRKKP